MAWMYIGPHMRAHVTASLLLSYVTSRITVQPPAASLRLFLLREHQVIRT